NRKYIRPLIPSGGMMNALMVLTVIFSFGVGIYTYNYLPFVDFLPYQVGSNLPENMRIPPGAPRDEYVITYMLKHKKSGETQKMTDKEYLKTEIWKDANWEIIGEPQNQLVKKG